MYGKYFALFLRPIEVLFFPAFEGLQDNIKFLRAEVNANRQSTDIFWALLVLTFDLTHIQAKNLMLYIWRLAIFCKDRQI